MSIENQLKLAFKQSAEQLKKPHQLDARIEQLFDTHSQAKGILPKWFSSSNKFTRIAVIAACLILFSGAAYASTLLYSMHSNHFKLEASSDSQLNFSQGQMKEIRGSINEVRSHLASGESAFIYIAELDKIKLPAAREGAGLSRINNPQPYLNINLWKDLTKKAFADFKTPTILPDGFTFTKGELENPIGIINMENVKKYYNLLKKKATAAQEKMAWQKAGAEDSIYDKDFISNSPRLIFTNNRYEQIEVSYTIIPASDKDTVMKHMVGDSSTAEKVRIADFEGYYTVNKNYIFNDTGYMQDINWLEQLNGQTIIYHVSTPSQNVTKADLVLVANNLK
jgi:hypothetical protein